MVSGVCSKPLPFEVQPGTKYEALFVKTPGSARGAVGVFTYDLCKTGSSCIEKIAVMFSVPFDYRIYSNWYAVGVFDSNKRCDGELYNELYNSNHSGLLRGAAKYDPIRHTHGNLVIDAAMSNTHTPHLLVKVHQDKKGKLSLPKFRIMAVHIGKLVEAVVNDIGV